MTDEAEKKAAAKPQRQKTAAQVVETRDAQSIARGVLVPRVELSATDVMMETRTETGATKPDPARTQAIFEAADRIKPKDE